MTDNATTDLRPPEMRTDPGPSGIGGWLLLPVLHLVIDIVVLLLTVATGFVTNHTFQHQAQSVSGQVLLLGYLLATLLVAIYAAYCLLQLFRKKRELPALMIGFYLAVLAKALWHAAMLWTYPELRTAAEGEFDTLRDIASAVMAGAVWVSYFRQSLRVRNTFVR